jgi:ribokinase
MASARKPIVVVGSINMDLVARTPRTPLPGQTVIGTDFTITPGGKGANQAVAVARLGYPVKMVGMVGEDVFGQALLDNLKNAGVGIEAVARVPGPSGVAPILVAPGGQNSIVVVPGANHKVDSAYIDKQKALILSAGMVLCQLELPMETLNHTLDVCAEAGIPVMLDPAPAAALDEKVWRHAAWFTPNETETAFYLGSKLEPETAARELLLRGLKGVVLKRGVEGTYVAVAGGKGAWVRPFPVASVDTVGAGDCFNGAFAVAMLEGKDRWTAAEFASAAAALSTTKRGAQASMPARAEVDALLAHNR